MGGGHKNPFRDVGRDEEERPQRSASTPYEPSLEPASIGGENSAGVAAGRHAVQQRPGIRSMSDLGLAPGCLIQPRPPFPRERRQGACNVFNASNLYRKDNPRWARRGRPPGVEGVLVSAAATYGLTRTDSSMVLHFGTCQSHVLDARLARLTAQADAPGG